MSDPIDPSSAPSSRPQDDGEPAATGTADGSTPAELDAYDLDGDGRISLVEGERARLGLVDARLEELAERDGITGKLAQAAHEVLDKFDND
jgi:hypothetical protein